MSNNFRTEIGRETGYNDRKGNLLHVGDTVKWQYALPCGDVWGLPTYAEANGKVVSIDELDKPVMSLVLGYVRELKLISSWLTITKKYNE